MKFELNIKTIQDNVKILTQQLTDLARKEVAVGVPEAAPDKDGVSQAYIAAIHEFGSPKNNIPKRSFLASALDDNLDKYANILTNEINSIVGRTRTSIIPNMKKLAAVVQNDVLAKFDNNDWDSLKYRQGTPLINTGELRQSIRGVVRDKR